ncbi:hypothetical protein A584_26243 [Pseudomonas syringae pv. theae ICMP 3923]|uniref:Restriction endonuclease n=3 Tax=Pseudomonas syringae group TaxID=136849 RepID=A0A261WMX5_9PSED|nr:hypothetical protein [Pseudomonas syringae]OZI87427.1 hypothetical protein CFN58_04350 [Pseudomonas avellanae]ATV20159.1 hypothetical protein CT122_27810 [Pseudomonas syringae pv. actinidiae]EPM47095.1 hypothetical protein A262_25462 [Pseudomonas syringae pv. actinidiae ICMP 19073]EPM63767.1 hypothetical protein A264_01998 [Pseudomonas syringae pv. actinidiae ICMP 19071]EPM66303.1 hypothetical protein A584_26243 [Pseudomonas syringae pv. theae ICMP 3923]
MKRIERDFVTLFNYLWYKDFPVTETAGLANRANWTIHMGLVVRQCASLLGARALFESGGRTDAVVQYSDNDVLTFVEWEWKRAHTDINEIEKLRKKANQAAFQTFIGYSRIEDVQEALDKTLSTWASAENPLIYFLVTYDVVKGSRHFNELVTYQFTKNRYKKIRSQPALPWMVNRKKFINADENT